jgi:hypothetical protein
VEVAAVDQRHLDVGATEVVSRLQATEAAADHRHPVTLGLCHASVRSRRSKRRTDTSIATGIKRLSG